MIWCAPVLLSIQPFQHHNLSYLALKIDNTTTEPVLRPIWKGTGYLETYVQALKALRILDRPEPVDIDMSQYVQGPQTVFGWDLSGDLSDDSPCKRGITSLDLQFSEPLPASGVTVSIYGHFHGMITVDADGKVESYDRIYREARSIGNGEQCAPIIDDMNDPSSESSSDSTTDDDDDEMEY